MLILEPDYLDLNPITLCSVVLGIFLHTCDSLLWGKMETIKIKSYLTFLYEYEINVCECVWEIEGYVKKRICDNTET